MLSTFDNFYDFERFLLKMFENIQEEYMLNFYLHRYVMSDVTYEEFRETVIAKMNSNNKTDEEILKEVKGIIDGFNKETNNEVHIEKDKSAIVLE